jgi:predicted GNAT family acetyltransferase
VSGSTLLVLDNPAELRYEALLDGRLAGFIRYTIDGAVVTLVHTDVAPSFKGRGVGAGLVEGALRDLRDRGRRLVPLCPFVAEYVHRSPEYNDLLATRT